MMARFSKCIKIVQMINGRFRGPSQVSPLPHTLLIGISVAAVSPMWTEGAEQKAYLVGKEVYPTCLKAALARQVQRLCLDCVLHCCREENGNSLQYSCLESSMDRGTWEATVHTITGSDMNELIRVLHCCKSCNVFWSYFYLIHGIQLRKFELPILKVLSWLYSFFFFLLFLEGGSSQQIRMWGGPLASLVRLLSASEHSQA